MNQPSPFKFVLDGHAKDLGGGFTVRRLLPSAQQQAVGPFLFFDHFGPITVNPRDNHDVRPHPHIGLSTVTYLFDGAITHRDSLGSVQVIEPGAINWMTAGSGIVHSERGPDHLREKHYVNHGIQLWAALPESHEETPAEFIHTPAADIPSLQVGDAAVRVLVGSAFGKTSPAKTYSPAIYLDVKLPAGGVFELPPLASELCLYAIDGDVTVDGEPLQAQMLGILAVSGQPFRIQSTSGAVRLMVLGGEPLGHRFIFWNFVSSSKERIARASADWEAQAMGQVAGETEFIPLPARKLA
ncbi:MAG: pirin family protein [Comamonadaceae bacterium]|nr:MAG: pirin family protein [Comamonadaceae bacterium]